MTEEIPVRRKDGYGFSKPGYAEDEGPDDTKRFDHEEYGELEAELYGDRIEVYDVDTDESLTQFRTASSDVALQIFDDIESSVQSFLNPEPAGETE